VLSPALFSLNYSDDYEGIRLFLTTMVDPARSAELRAIGHAQLAFLELALGRWRAARAQLDTVGALEPSQGIETGGLVLLTPFLTQVSRVDLEALRTVLLHFDAAAIPPSAVVSGYFGVHNGAHPQLRSYLLGLVDARLGDDGAAESLAASLERSADTVLSRILFRPLARSVRAAVLERQGRAGQAVRALGASDVSYEPAIFSSFFARPLERYRRAVLLDTLGRPDEAARWYRSFRYLSLADRIYEAPAAYRLGLMLERQGRLGDARGAYRRVALLWKDCDPELRPLLDDARARLARLGG
jgi:tetratricopeptide (TPR) repeat protein